MTIDITLRFEDEEAAKEFAALYFDKETHRPGLDLINIQKVPDSYCTCPFQKGKAYTRGKTYGWYVCPLCNKMDRKSFVNFNVLGPGINLIPLPLRANPWSECNESSPREWSFLNG